MIPMKPIKITAKKQLKISQWIFDQPELQEGETAHITGVLAAHPENPLYQVTKRNGKVFAVMRSDLLRCGALD